MIGMSRPMKMIKPGSKLFTQAAVGGNGGYIFDSGCNPSGVTKVHIDCSEFRSGGFNYKMAIRRVFLKFEDNLSFKHPSYDAFEALYADASNIISFAFETPSGDKISKISVWNDVRCVQALQFQTQSGRVSQVFGMITNESCRHDFEGGSRFQGGDDDVHLVGVHERCRGLIDKLGFTFGSVVQSRLLFL